MYTDQIKDKRLQAKQDKDEAAHRAVFESLATELRSMLDSLETAKPKKLDQEYIAAINKLEHLLSAIDQVKLTADDELKSGIKLLAQILLGMDMKPVINVAPAKVDIPAIDTKGIEKALSKALKAAPKVSIQDFRAQDIDNEELGIQYIGFINPQSIWMIIRNDIDKDQLRYKFGKDNYTQAFAEASKFEYKLFDEALSDISA